MTITSVEGNVTGDGGRFCSDLCTTTPFRPPPTLNYYIRYASSGFCRFIDVPRLPVGRTCACSSYAAAETGQVFARFFFVSVASVCRGSPLVVRRQVAFTGALSSRVSIFWVEMRPPTATATGRLVVVTRCR
jgi:hypothetical protein